MAGTINETDMYNLLSQVFKPEVANTLLQQLKGETKPAPIVDWVMPGDLITAEFMNQMLAVLADLQLRVAELEGGSAEDGVIIYEPNLSTTLHIDDRLTIVGKNILPDSIVSIDNALLTSGQSSTDNSRFVFDHIPPFDTIEAGGRFVTLEVSNAKGKQTAKFKLLPMELTTLLGELSILQSGGPPAGTKYTPGGRYTFTFTITADTRPDETFLVIPSVDTGWTAYAVVSAAANAAKLEPAEISIKAAANATTPTIATVYVAVLIPYGTATQTTGKLTLQIKSKKLSPSRKWLSPPVSITVDGNPQPTRQITVSLSTTTAGDAAVRSNSDGSRTALVAPNSAAELYFDVIVP